MPEFDIITNIDGEEIKIKVENQNARYPNDYKLDHEKFKFFQFDSCTPEGYIEQYVLSHWWRGYLISKNRHGKNIVTDCSIKLIYRDNS